MDRRVSGGHKAAALTGVRRPRIDPNNLIDNGRRIAKGETPHLTRTDIEGLALDDRFCTESGK